MSKKYVIEIKPEYEDSFKGLMLLGAKDSNLYVDTLAVESLEKYIPVDVEKIYDKAYGDGYNKGFEDGKDSIDKGCEGCRYEPLSEHDEPCKSCANSYLCKYEPMPKQDDFKVGDEVTAYNELIREVEHFVVIEVGGYFGEGNIGLFLLYGKDKTSVDFKAGCFSISAKAVTKTGRHFDIEGILEAMKNG